MALYRAGLQNKQAFVYHLSEGTDRPELMAWIENYCRAHPRDDVAAASYALAEDLFDKWRGAHAPPKPQ
jgi:hypothetical protein